MGIFLDWILIIIGTMIVLKAYKKVCFECNCSLANIVICLVYIFCVLPILLNYLIGIPNYDTLYWYKVFIGPMNNEKITIIYDIYILFSIILLFIYSKKYKPKPLSNNKFPLINSKIISTIVILLPYIYIILTGTIKNYLVYGTKSYRGFENINTSHFVLMMAFIFLSLFTYYSNFFKNEKKTKLSYFLFLLYNFSIIWISGKRFIIASIIFTIIYYLSQSDLKEKSRNRMYKTIPIAFIALTIFSIFYLQFVRPLTDTSSSSVYDMLRVDFGRDDVIKYTIDKELIKGERILDYRGETFLSTVFVLVPREIWPSKPFQHYMYLTSSILNLSIYKLPAGTTPSWYEMCISNFGVLGMLVACFGLVALCKIADNSKHIDIKYIWLIFIEVLLTQSIDSYTIYIGILLLLLLFMFLKKLRKDLNK